MIINCAEDADGFVRAVQSITFVEFCQVLKQTNGADEGYCKGVWPDFQDNPLYYIASRTPKTQGTALIGLIEQKLYDAEHLLSKEP